jgi:chemotaxis protein MotB
MSSIRRTSREQPPHVDDWLITYADMITLLLCFFVIFYVILSMRKNGSQEAPQTGAPAQVVQLSAPAAARTPAPHVAQPNSILNNLGTFDFPQVIPTPVLTPNLSAKRDVASKGDRITAFEMGGSELFDSGSATLRQDGKSILQGIAVQLRSDRYDGYQIDVEGHTDDTPIATPQFSSNWELSMARAAAVVHFLLDQGIAPNRLRAAGFGDTEPKVPNRNVDGSAIPENQAENRRVVIRLEKIQTPS